VSSLQLNLLGRFGPGGTERRMKKHLQVMNILMLHNMAGFGQHGMIFWEISVTIIHMLASIVPTGNAGQSESDVGGR
jgi:hypothetical protein